MHNYVDILLAHTLTKYNIIYAEYVIDQLSSDTEKIASDSGIDIGLSLIILCNNIISHQEWS
jgi:hypothetical protein